MKPLALAVDYNVLRLQFHAAPHHRRVRAPRKAHEDECGRQRDIADPRYVLFAAQQIEVMQGCPGQAGLERALTGNEKIEPRLAQARLVVIGVDEGACAASRHPRSCTRAGSNPRSEGPRCRPELPPNPK